MAIVKYTLEQAYQKCLSDVKVWCRFDQLDNLLPKPTDDEIRIAIDITVDDINSVPPRTSSTLLGSINSADAFYTTIMYGTCKNVLWSLLVDWTGNGIDAQLDSLSLQSRRSDYESLFRLAEEMFEKRLSNIKISYGSKSISARNSGGNNRKSVLRPAYHSSGNFAAISNAKLYRP